MPDIEDFEDYREFLVICVIVKLDSLKHTEIKYNCHKLHLVCISTTGRPIFTD